MEIFVNGIQRTGTNYTRQLLKENIDHGIHDRMPPYHKHDSFTGIKPTCDSIICVIKNPYTWVESICFRNCVDIKEKNSQLFNKTDSIGNFNINLIELCRLYKKFYTSWINYGVNLVHYENLLDEQYVKMFLNKNFNWVGNNIQIPKNVDFSANFEKKQIQWYKNYDLFYLHKNHIDIINEQLDNNFLNLIEYPIK